MEHLNAINIEKIIILIRINIILFNCLIVLINNYIYLIYNYIYFIKNKYLSLIQINKYI